jgi:hypothetical protein
MVDESFPSQLDCTQWLSSANFKQDTLEPDLPVGCRGEAASGEKSSSNIDVSDKFFETSTLKKRY